MHDRLFDPDRYTAARYIARPAPLPEKYRQIGRRRLPAARRALRRR